MPTMFDIQARQSLELGSGGEVMSDVTIFQPRCLRRIQ
jgi:hypothetical protein